MMDGQDFNDVGLGGESIQPILPDFFSSVTTLLNDSSAEYGRAGGAVINQITQHGTNRFHGNVHEIYTGSGLDSIDGQSRRAKPLLPGQPIPKARYDTHQLGGTLGGPIFKDKLFGFGGATFQRFYGTTQATPVELPDSNGYATLKTLASAGNAQANSYLAYLNNGSYLAPSLLHRAIARDPAHGNSRRQSAGWLRLRLQHHHRDIPAQRCTRTEPRYPMDRPRRFPPARHRHLNRPLYPRPNLPCSFPLSPQSHQPSRL